MLLTKTRLRNFFRFRSIQSRLLGAFSIFIAFNFLIILGFYIFISQESRIEDLKKSLDGLDQHVNQVIKLERDFLLIEIIQEDFHRSRKSIFLEGHKQQLDTVYQILQVLQAQKELQGIQIKKEAQLISDQVKTLEQIYEKLVNLVHIRGFKDYGLEGKMRSFIHEIEDSIKTLDLSKVLMLRRHEKDFILRKEEKYIDKLIRAANILKEDAQKITVLKQKRKATRLLELYIDTFKKLVDIEKEIGYLDGGGGGLRATLNIQGAKIRHLIHHLNEVSFLHLDQLRFRAKIFVISFFVCFILFNIFLGYYVIYKISRPIQKLSESIYQVIQNNFNQNSQIYQTNTEDEVGGISRDVNVMLENVKQRRLELTEEKEKLEQTYQNIKLLSEIGQEITANLSFDSIVRSLRHHITQLMEVSVFAVGLFNERKNRIEFLKEEYNLFQRYDDWIEIKEENDLAIHCYLEAKEILIQDFEREYCTFTSRVGLKKQPELKVHSLILLPLIFKGATIGILTVQSSCKNSYSEYHLNILSNLRNYLTIALDNAHIYEKLNANNKKVLDSINYAQKIQEAMLPSLENIKTYIPNSFFLYKPRDIVSGDFYWFAEQDLSPKYRKAVLDMQTSRANFKKTNTSRKLLAVVDCTGHGVPGALMSMIGHDLLNQIVLQHHVSEADLILNHLHEGIKSCFRQKENTDGMDLGICVIDFEERCIEYAGAFMPLVVIQNQEMKVIRPNKKPVGVWYRENEERTYEKQRIELNPELETSFYLYTDGYVDQLGGPNRKKFLSVNFYKLLMKIHHQPMETQKQILARELKKWRGKEAQNDDILVVGFKIGPQELL